MLNRTPLWDVDYTAAGCWLGRARAEWKQNSGHVIPHHYQDHVMMVTSPCSHITSHQTLSRYKYNLISTLHVSQGMRQMPDVSHFKNLNTIWWTQNMLFETCYICQQTLQPIIYHTICYKGDNPNSKMLIQYILPKTVCDQVWLVLAVRWAQWTLPGKQNNDKCIRCAAIRQPSWKLQQYHSEWVRQIGCGQLSGIQRGEAWCLPQLTWLRHWIMIALQTTD